ncbi:MAG: transcription termination factor Rho [Clostridia bacterium]|nr:transcription termination factor Rho [Clostridia bacterium]
MEQTDYSSLSLVELRTLAKERGIAAVTSKRKAELIALLSAPEPTPPKKRGRPPKARPAAQAEPPKAEPKPVPDPEPVPQPAPQPEPAPEAKPEPQAAPEPAARSERSRRNDARQPRGRENARQPHTGRPQQHREPHKEQEESTEGPKPAVSALLQAEDCRVAEGVLEIMEGYGFLRVENYFSGPNDVYVSIAQIRRFNLRQGDLVRGRTRPRREGDKYDALLYIDAVNGEDPEQCLNRVNYESLIPIFPNERYTLEVPGKLNDLSVRLIDLIAPIGKGQRAMIVSQPKAGKTTLLKQIAAGISTNYPDSHLIVLLIDERPEEVTDMRRFIRGEVVASTFDELPEHHTRIAEMVQERAMRLVELGKDVVILLDSLTRLTRAYNLVIPPTGRTLSGGMDPGALHRPKRFFGAARNIENGGSLTVIATALVETGSRMDDIVYEEFKGTGNMEIHLDRRMSEKRVFPAIDIYKSGTRREDLLLSKSELDGVYKLRRVMAGGGAAPEVTESVIGMLSKTTNNEDFLQRLGDWIRIYEKQGYTAPGQNRYGQ